LKQLLVGVNKKNLHDEVDTGLTMGSEAWLTPPIDSDSGMNMPDLGLNALIPLKEAYLLEVAYHLSWVPRLVRRLFKPRG